MMQHIADKAEHIYLALGATDFRRQQNGLAVLIYECLYEEGIALYNELSDTAFKKLIPKQYNYIKQIAKE